MERDNILVLADEFDTHADVVIKHITDEGGKCVRLNLNVEALANTAITAFDDIWTVRTRAGAFTGENISAVWPRRLSISRTLEQQFEPDTNESRLWRSEWNRALYGFYNTLRGRFWFNPIQAASLADNKIYQSAKAREIGLAVPEWTISNNKIDLIQFMRRHGEAALKFMSQDMYRDANGSFKGMYVNKISEKDLDDFGDFSENPVTLQTYISKAYEVRYTVVEDEHFCCAIHSQVSDKAKTDWRRYDLPNTPHQIIEPPHIVRSRVSQLMSNLGLYYGALDFIVDPEGQWWFLEVNTAGQWLWIEDLTGLPISSAIARLLVARSRGECK